MTTKLDVAAIRDRLDAHERLLDGLRLDGVSIVERGDMENAWAITNARAVKAEQRVEALEAALADIAEGKYDGDPFAPTPEDRARKALKDAP